MSADTWVQSELLLKAQLEEAHDEAKRTRLFFEQSLKAFLTRIGELRAWEFVETYSEARALEAVKLEALRRCGW